MIFYYYLAKVLELLVKEKLDDNTNSNLINYSVKTELDSKVVLPPKNQAAKVIIWLE